MSYDQGISRDFVMSEQQFEELEAFCKTEMKKMVFQNYGKTVNADTVPIKSLIFSLRDKLQVFENVNNLLFKPDRPAKESLQAIKFFNSVKQVLIRSGGPD